MLDVIRSLALDCSLHVNLLVTGVHPWRPECLSRFNPYAQGQDAAPEYEAIESKLERVAASLAPQFEGSKAAYQMFVDKIFSRRRHGYHKGLRAWQLSSLRLVKTIITTSSYFSLDNSTS